MREIALLAPRDAVLVDGAQGGSSVVLLEDRRLLEAAGWEVVLYGPPALHEVPVRTMRLDSISRRLSSLEYCGRFVIENPRGVLLSYNEPTVAVLAPGRSIVRFDWQTPLPRYWRLFPMSRRFRRATYLFPSHSCRNLWYSMHSGFPEEKSVVIHNSVDLRTFRPGSRGQRGRRIGFAGQWISDKGLHVLLAAWKEVRTVIPDVELWVAGGPDLWKTTHPIPKEKTLATNTLTQGSPDGLRLVGVLPRSEMPDFWSQIDIACFPSTWEEPFGLSALEAMACGVPVVVSQSGALPEVVANGGTVVPKGDERALARALTRMLLSPGLVDRLRVEARQRACTFSEEQRAAKLLALVERIRRSAPTSA